MESVRRYRYLLAVVGLALLGAAIWWVGGTAVLQALQRCGADALLLAAAAIVTATLLGAWNCYRIAELKPALTFRQFLPVFWRSWAAGISLPGQVADFVATLWQLRGRTGDLHFVAGRLLLDKGITLGVMLALLALLPFAVGVTGPLASFVAMATLCVTAVAALALLDWVGHRPDLWPRHRWTRSASSALAGARAPARLVLGNLAVTAAKTLASGLAYWAVLGSIASEAPGFGITTIVSQSAGLVAYLPISFNGLGTVEVSAIALFGAVGVDDASVVSAYLVLRTITMGAAWLPIAVGALAAGGRS